MMTFLNQIKRWWWMAMVIVTLTACGGGGSGDVDSGGDETGQLTIGLTDAPGDFSAYMVDVVSIKLTRANGTIVETLPLTTRVDFAQYTEMTEFITAATVPAGLYVKGELTLDYSNADIWVEGNDGQPVKVEQDNILDGDGNPVSQFTVSVNLEGRHALPIAPGIPKHLSLDFNLEESNDVVFEADVPKVTVKPVLLAQVDPESPKPHRIRGPLLNVDVAQSRFSMYLRPFLLRIVPGVRYFGQVIVTVKDDTAFEIDEQAYQGQTGLEVLADIATGTPVIVIGEIKFGPLRFEAKEVYAGTSVPGYDLDLVHATVTARDGDTLTVKGATWLQGDGVVVFNDIVTVTVDDSTKVVKQLSNEPVDIDALSVGQRIGIAGTMTNTDLKDLQMDARNGLVRMVLSTIKGAVVGVEGAPEPQPFVLNLSHINRRPVSIFDFSGTGIDADNDADPTYYEIDYGNLDISPFPVDSQVYVRGFVRPFGQAPLDFEAKTIIGGGAVTTSVN